MIKSQPVLFLLDQVHLMRNNYAFFLLFFLLFFLSPLAHLEQHKSKAAPNWSCSLLLYLT